MRFRTKQLLIATAIVAACLAAILSFKEHQKRVLFTRLYGTSEIYDAVRACNDFSLYRVTSPSTLNAIDWKTPAPESLVYVRALPSETANELRGLFTSPDNFDLSVVKDFVFSPSIMLESNKNQAPLRIFLDFQSNEAALLLEDNKIGFVAIDGLSSTLQKVLAEPVDNKQAAPE